MRLIKVLIPKTDLFPLDYYLSESKKAQPGELIVVPFRNQTVTGIVWELDCPPSEKKLKIIDQKSKFVGQLSWQQLDFIKKMSNYYLAQQGTIAKLVLPVDVNEDPIIVKKHDIGSGFALADLSVEQNDILNRIRHLQKPVVIKGVTGSGKTEIYFHIIAEALLKGQQALIMLPEIALGNQIINRFYTRFGFKPEIWNANISKAKKKQILRGIIQGDIRVVVGARSSLFLPYKNLSVIIVDEEHDNSYKQHEGLLYHARDMAVLLASLIQAKVILVSATPSIETIYNSNLNKYELIELKTRFKEAILPAVEIIDMRNKELNKDSVLSARLVQAIHDTLAKKQQVLLFLNRRGYAPLLLCKICGYQINCLFCSAAMVIHKESKRLECHHCGKTTNIYSRCPECQKESLQIYGVGIERIAEEVKAGFPDYKIAIISRDNSLKEAKIQLFLQEMEQGIIDIVIGTQIITKGYHFPYLTLVGVIDADMSFVGGDLRGSERTYQLLQQVGGRAGREENRGTVLLQTYHPENKVLIALKNGNEKEFIAAEIASRKSAAMPPFTKTAMLIISGKSRERSLAIAKKLLQYAPQSEAKILGPAEASIFRIAGKYRYKILIIAGKNFNLQKYLRFWLQNVKIPSFVQLKIDVDPYNFL